MPFDLIDTKQVSSRTKWDKVLRDSDWDDVLKNGHWGEHAYLAQGNAFLVKEHAPVFPVWDLSNLNQESRFCEEFNFVEHVHLDTGLYFGDRNTEPRAALVMHFILPGEHNGQPMPVDIFVVNTHLTTLMKEREGVPNVDSSAVRIRLSQLDIIFNGIVSRYNSWRLDGYPSRREPHVPLPTEDVERFSPIWILAGDFNFTEESEEYQYIKRRNFIDTVEEKEGHLGGRLVKGTKASGVGNPPTLTLDYVFAGPMFVSFDPMLKKVGVALSRVIYEIPGANPPALTDVSDHYPVLSTIDFKPIYEGKKEL